MVNGFKYLSLFLFFLLISHSFPQFDKILKKESELTSIKTEIKNLESEFDSKSAAEKKSFEAVENLNRQNYLINKILSELRTEIKNKDREIRSLLNKISLTEAEIKSLQDNYAKYVKAIYKKGKYNELESLLNSESLQQALMRTYYLQRFSKKREQDLVKLKDKKNELAEAKVLLENEKRKKSLLAKVKDAEKKSLLAKLDDRKTILNSIKKKKTEISKLIDAKKEAQRKMEDLIAKLVEEEEKRKLQQQDQIASTDDSFEEKNTIRDEGKKFDYDLSTSSFSSFSDLKGKMNWPLHKGKIIRKFGETKNKSLNTVTLNYGIDIKADKDKNVRCVGEGVIAAIDWLPGYGNVVIVSHKDGYRTVYSHLSEIFVNEGDKVKSGSVLALVDEGLDGYVLHFEIWKARDKQNPENWLAKK